jgi:ABC-2 type transport system permease protein
MAATALLAMIRKDLRLFFTDRRAVIVTFVMPIAIASFFGSVFSGEDRGDAAKVPVVLVDQDGGAIAQRIGAAVAADESLAVHASTADAAREEVRKGAVSVAVVIPAGFGDAASRAFFAGRNRPELTLLYDPSKSMELSLVRGLLTQHVMESVSREVFTTTGGLRALDDTLQSLDTIAMPPQQKALLGTLLKSAREFYQSAQSGPEATGQSSPGLTMPYTVSAQRVTSGNAKYNGYAHSFAGMGIQFLLFAMIDLGVNILLERQRGLWKRLRSAPVSRLTLLGGKAASGTIIALIALAVSFAFAIVVFGVRISGSMLGFAAVSIACAAMAASFGLLVAAVGKTPASARGLASFAALMMVMLGGAWVPTFVFPQWVQRITVVVPTRWAVDGFDAMTWRGLGATAAIAPTLVLSAFALLFATMAWLRFRWEEQ